MRTRNDTIASMEASIAHSFRSQPVEWRREMIRCLELACIENEYLSVDNVWEQYFLRGGVEHEHGYAMGGVMRHGVGGGWMEHSERPEGFPRIVSNHNDKGTGVYRSLIYDPEYVPEPAKGTGFQMRFPDESLR